MWSKWFNMGVFSRVRVFLLVAVFLALPLTASADGSCLKYFAAFSSLTASGENAPFWLVSKQQGLFTLDKSSGFARYGLSYSSSVGQNKSLSYELVADFTTGYNRERAFAVQQLYAELLWKNFTLTVGSKERFAELRSCAFSRENFSFATAALNREFPSFYYNKFTDISSGGLLYSGNSKPVPQVRIEVPRYVDVPRTGGWLKVRGHIAYGIFLDGDFQRDFSRGNSVTRYAENVLFHSKALFFKVGRPEKFPVTFEGGLEMYSQFGGDVYKHGEGKVVSMPARATDFLKALIPWSGSDDTPLDEQTNISGNQIGNWHAALTLHLAPVDVCFYGEHIFEDFSQLFFIEYQSNREGKKRLIYYPWRDFLAGVRVTNKSDVLPFVSNLQYEFLSTYDQSGALYHDPTSTLKEQMDGVDDYYNHGIYPGWHYWGVGIGNPLIVSPVYNVNGSLKFSGNRVIAHHLGVNGDFGSLPLAYRLMYTYSENWGTYLNPYDEKKYTNSFLLDIAYTAGKGEWGGVLSVGCDHSNLVGNNWGVLFTLFKMGFIK